MPQAQPVAFLRKQAAQAPAAVLESRLLARHAERHVARLPLHAQLAKQLHQVGIGAIVVDNKTGVNGRDAAAGRYRMGMGVSAETIFPLQQVDLVLAAQQIGRRHPRYAGADYRDAAHVLASASLCGSRTPRNSRAIPIQFRTRRP